MHESIISNYYDGKFVHTTIKNAYLWVDGEYTHEFFMLNDPQFWIDFMKNLSNAMERWQNYLETAPQISEEIGDISFAEYSNFMSRNYYV